MKKYNKISGLRVIVLLLLSALVTLPCHSQTGAPSDPEVTPPTPSILFLTTSPSAYHPWKT